MPDEKPPIMVTPEDAGVMDLSPEELGIVSAGVEKRVDKPSFLEKTVSNIPSSLGNVLTHPVGSAPMGAPGAKENYARGEYPDQFSDVLPKVQKFMEHPWDNTVDAVKGAISEHPVETALGVGAMGRQAMPNLAAKTDAVVGGAAQGAYQGATDMIPFSRWGHKLNVPAPLAGAAGGELLAYPFSGLVPHAPVIGAAIGGVAPIIKGAYQGGKAALSEFKNTNVSAPPHIPTWMQGPVEAMKSEDIPVGPTVKPILPSGRKPGSLAAQEMPVAAPETKQAKAVEPVRHEPNAQPAGEPEAPKGQQKAPETAPEKSTSEGENIKPSTVSGWEVIDKNGDKTFFGDDDFKGKAEENAKNYMQKSGGTIIRHSIGDDLSKQVQKSKIIDIQTEPDQWTWESLKDQHGQAAVDRVKAKYSDLATRIKAADISMEKFLALPKDAQDAIVKIPKHPTQPNRSKYSNGYNPKYENLFKELHGQSE